MGLGVELGMGFCMGLGVGVGGGVRVGGLEGGDRGQSASGVISLRALRASVVA